MLDTAPQIIRSNVRGTLMGALTKAYETTMQSCLGTEMETGKRHRSSPAAQHKPQSVGFVDARIRCITAGQSPNE